MIPKNVRDLAVLGLICLATGLQAKQELIHNPSFDNEVPDEHWTFSERTALWKVEQYGTSSTRPEYIRHCGTGRNGSGALCIGPWKRSTDMGVETAVFVSQFRDLSGSSDFDAPLLLSFWTKGKKSNSLTVNLDINYKDNRFLFVKANPEGKTSDDTFVRTCVFIPNYGSIQSAMIHIILDVDVDETIHVDDVSLRYVKSLKPNSKCSVYVKSFPVQRSVFLNYLKPSHGETDHRITLATQFTKDRFDIVEQTAAIWKGPISAALILYGSSFQSELSEVVKRFYASKELQSYVTLHVVWEDQLNGKDAKFYPANALRNIAIGQSSTEYVFYLDADIFPVFSEEQAWKWLSDSIEKAKELSNIVHCEKCAFVAPLINRDSTEVGGYPQTKEELQKLITAKSEFTTCALLSHSVIDYGKWLKSESTYKLDYVQDMEPYFIVPSTAPLMNDIYTGYGRDKCAYSRDLHAARFEFFVLPEAFVINIKEPPGTMSTIMIRSHRIPNRLFLNIAFHQQALKHHHFQYPSKTFQSQHHNLTTKRLAKPDSDERKVEQETVPTGNQENPTDVNGKATANGGTSIDHKFPGLHLDSEDGGIGCNLTFFDLKLSLIPEMMSIAHYVQAHRKDLVVEQLMKVYGVHTYIELPSTTITGNLRFMLPFMQPEAAVSLLPESDADEHVVNGIFEFYKLKQNRTEALKSVSVKHPGAKIFSVNIEKLSEVEAERYVLACLQVADDNDVILIDSGTGAKSDSFWSLVLTDMCVSHSNWKTYRKHDFVIMKSGSLIRSVPEPIPAFPSCLDTFTPNSRFTTDIVLFSKNRPLQTFAFMDSLKKFVTGVNKVWLLVKTEDSIFDLGYDMIVECFSSFASIEVIKESGKETLGGQILNIIETSTAYSVLIAVDEIIWLRAVNLSVVSSLLYDCRNDDTAMFQLRLGENIKIGAMQNQGHRFESLPYDDNILAYYPRRLPYDFGYVLNVDGVVARRTDLLEDFKDILPTCFTPGCVEQKWILNSLQRRSRQWHFMYRYSRMVNNMGMSDGRVADRRDGPAAGSYELANILVKDRKKINIEKFAEKYKDHDGTHQSKPVEYVDLKC